MAKKKKITADGTGVRTVQRNIYKVVADDVVDHTTFEFQADGSGIEMHLPYSNTYFESFDGTVWMTREEGARMLLALSMALAEVDDE
jgi:hypothetical protein